jgi:hypothetical protein
LLQGFWHGVIVSGNRIFRPAPALNTCAIIMAQAQATKIDEILIEFFKFFIDEMKNFYSS